ncbi:MAG: hypothetical protein J6V32_01860 [Elusimicrobiaceae bacterium]|nr:hypothetical protein [Elusimicrobiaceae bacterium]
MKTSRFSKITGVVLLAVLLLPMLTRAQTWEKAGEAVIKSCKEVGGTVKYAEKVGTATPGIKNVEEIAGKVERAVAKASQTGKIAAEVAKPGVSGSSVVNGAAVNLPKRASEQINNLVGTGTRPTIAPATGKKFQPNPTKYYSMTNNAEEVPSLTQKVPSSTPSPIEPQASIPETVSGEIGPQAPIPETVSGEPVVSQETLQVVEDTAAKSNPAVVSDAAPKTAETKHRKTAEEWLAEYWRHPEELKHGTPMYKAFDRVNRRVKEAQEAGQEVDKASLEMADIWQKNTKGKKTTEEWLAEYWRHPEKLKNGTPMYKAFVNVNQRVKKAQAAGQEVEEAFLEMADIWQKNTKGQKTAEEWLTEYRQHPEELKRGTPMYNAFENVNQRVKKAQEAGEKVDKVYLDMVDILQENTRGQKTAEEWLVEYRQHPEELKHGTPMYKAFENVNRRVKKAQAAGEKVDKAYLDMADIWQKNTKRQKIAEEWLAEYRRHPEKLKNGTPMYNAFENVNRRVKKAQAAGQEVEEAFLEMAKIYLENTKRISPASTSEVYEMFLTYLKENKSYPLATSQEYQVVYKRLYGKTAEEIKADPDLYKLSRLDQLARAARRGEKSWEVFDREDPLRRLRVGEKEKNYGVSVAEEKQLFNQLKGNYEHAWDNYPTWYNESKQYIVFTPQTQTAFKVIDREVAAGRESDELMELVDMLQKKELGYSENAFNRLIYRGNQSLLPKAEDFHLVAEEQGVPDLPNVREIFPQDVPNVYFKFADGKMSTLGLTKGVTSQDVQTVVDGILQELNRKVQIDAEWTVRMGTHEIGDKPHIHFEFVDRTGEGYDLSYTLKLDVPEEVVPMGYSWDNKARYNGFKKLFGNYMQ